MTMNTPKMKPFSSLHPHGRFAPLALDEAARGSGRGRAGHAHGTFALGGVALACLFLAGCAGKSVPPAEPADEAASEGTVASGVNATVIVNKCPDAARVNVRAAQDAIQKLVGPCASVPGGRAHFSATLQPGGNIVLASPEGDPAEGVVPTCVLKNKLSHRIPLKSPCALDVQLDERTVTVERPSTGVPDTAPSASATSKP